MRRSLSLAALLLVAACSGQDPAPATNDATQNAALAPETERVVPALEGQWQVAALDGRPVGSSSAMTATFKDGRAIVSSGCLRRAWTYTQKKNVVAFSADPAGSSNCGGGTSGDQETAYAVISSANIAIFDNGGGEASLSGTGGNLTLRRR
jgi:hypothetical protein